MNKHQIHEADLSRRTVSSQKEGLRPLAELGGEDLSTRSNPSHTLSEVSENVPYRVNISVVNHWHKMSRTCG